MEANRSGVRVPRPCFVLQGVLPTAPSVRPARVGFTVTKKLGSAVVRNRIRRRFKAALQILDKMQAENLDVSAPPLFREGGSYVLIARPGSESFKFHKLIQELQLALLRANGILPAKPARAHEA